MLHDVVCSRLARFVQQCCAQACALVLFSTRNMSQHVAKGWPNACNMLRSVAFKCCDRLAGACKCWANIVGICCVEMLLSFGRGLREVPSSLLGWLEIVLLLAGTNAKTTS